MVSKRLGADVHLIWRTIVTLQGEQKKNPNQSYLKSPSEYENRLLIIWELCEQ